MKPPMLTREQARKALAGVLTRYGIDPSMLSQKIQRKALDAMPLIAKTPKSREPILQSRALQGSGHGGFADTPAVVPIHRKEMEFHYLVEMSGSALVFHFRTHAGNVSAAKRTMLEIPNLTRWSTLLGAALDKVLADEEAMDLNIAAAST